MKAPIQTTFQDRLAASRDAKAALLAKFKPKPTVTDQTTFAEREAQRAAEREKVRLEREAAKEAARLAKLAQEEAKREALLNDEQHQLELKRQERKDRKAAAKEEARLRKEAKKANRGVAPDPWKIEGW